MYNFFWYCLVFDAQKRIYCYNICNFAKNITYFICFN